MAGAWALLAVTPLAEAFPVPLERVPVGGTSLATTFIVGTSVIYGWDAATVTAFLAMIIVEVARRRPLTRVAYNSGVYALAGVGDRARHGGRPQRIISEVIAAREDRSTVIPGRGSP